MSFNKPRWPFRKVSWSCRPRAPPVTFTGTLACGSNSPLPPCTSSAVSWIWNLAIVLFSPPTLPGRLGLRARDHDACTNTLQMSRMSAVIPAAFPKCGIKTESVSLVCFLSVWTDMTSIYDAFRFFSLLLYLLSFGTNLFFLFSRFTQLDFGCNKEQWSVFRAVNPSLDPVKVKTCNNQANSFQLFPLGGTALNLVASWVQQMFLPLTGRIIFL